MAPGLHGDDLPLNARQQQLRFGQGQTQVGDIDEIIRPSDDTANLLDWGRDGARQRRRARSYVAAVTPVTSAQT